MRNPAKLFLCTLVFSHMVHPICAVELAIASEASAFFSNCIDGTADVGDQGDYLMLSHLTDPLFKRSTADSKVQVHILDQTEVQSHRDIIGAVEAIVRFPGKSGKPREPSASSTVVVQSGKQRCLPLTYKNDHHSTHMAGIIASQDNGYGFIGINPNVSITSYYLKHFNPEAVAKEIRTLNQTGELKVVLLTTKFEYDDKDKDGSRVLLAQNEELADKHVISRAIKDAKQKVIVVVSAGQVTSGPPPHLQKDSGLLPMNLGSLANVIVVTACIRCNTSMATLMQDAFTAGIPGLIHIGAPGNDIPSLTADSGANGYGKASGTSQAAAYVAGVVTSMIQKKPKYYLNPSSLKQRLLVTAFPNFPDYHDWVIGTVDPSLAMLDPEKTWLQSVSQPTYKEIKLKNWCGEKTLVLADPKTGVNLREMRVLMKEIMRIRRRTAFVENDPHPQWFVWYPSEPQNSESGISRTPAGIWVDDQKVSKISEPIARLEDGDLLKLGEIEDLIVGSGDVTSGVESCQ